MKLIRKYPLQTVALAIMASGAVTYAYGYVQYGQQECSSTLTRSTLLTMQTQLGVLDSKVSMLSTSQRDQGSAALPPGVKTLGQLARERGVDADHIEQRRETEEWEIALERLKQNNEAMKQYIDVQQICLSKDDYSGLLAVLQVLLAGLVSFVGFVAGTLKGAAAEVELLSTAAARSEPQADSDHK